MISAEFFLFLAASAIGGATTYTLCRRWPARESPKPDLDQVDRFIEKAAKAKANDMPETSKS